MKIKKYKKSDFENSRKKESEGKHFLTSLNIAARSKFEQFKQITKNGNVRIVEYWILRNILFSVRCVVLKY